ncbi:prolyl oligopeptidase family serine peptidase [Psychrobacter sp. B38]|uniref:alpha/beta hydrolase family protein n=1 Tax=Psychrobacter sp. B38 TaxID=3143538 RepID=UPI00320C719F
MNKRISLERRTLCRHVLFTIMATLLSGAMMNTCIAGKPTLASLHNHYQTTVKAEPMIQMPLPVPPPRLFEAVQYDSDAMSLAAFVTPDPADEKKHPAIVWLTGGESNTLADFWRKGAKSNDQTASPYRDAGVVMMFPTLRGGNDNAGHIEVNYGEVNDVIAAAQYLATLSYVDSNRIYLGGHSTGGTLALLVSEVASSTHPNLFKEVISFGATQETMFLQDVNFDKGDKQREVELRAPTRWIQDIKVPTWIIEGKSLSSNYRDLKPMCHKNPMLHCAFIPNHDHFSVLYPINRHIAQQIMADQPISINVDDKTTAF